MTLPPQLKQRDVKTCEQALLLIDTIVNDIASSKKGIRVIWGEIKVHHPATSAEKMLENVYERLNALYETVELHGHYRKILTDADIECLFAELQQELRDDFIRIDNTR